MAPPPYISSDRVEAIYRGPAPPTVINEVGSGFRETIPNAFVEYEDEVYEVDARTVDPVGKSD
jgi:hypothetical protein